ncbi:phage portal protein [Caulobacter sp. BP25]|uniref:phage portal protein n=1 Tax=Caulobacter sp. BP25 TaxID=2048900 RepID=UPI000C12C60A|nr:phage portal protein [Caulobacter sp. BP25]PHY20922.1 phage portal protein [Caulobacter sp. BP25]
MALLHPSGREITRQEIARARASANAGEGRRGHAYQGADDNGVWTANWPARLQSADRDWLPARNMSVARARDLVNNELGGRSIISRRRNAAVGRGWRRSSRPSARALGITKEQARELGQAIEVEWDLYAYGHNFSCDAERRFTFGQLLRVAATHLMQDGEFLAIVEWAEEEPTKYKTRLRMVDPDRLCNPRGLADNAQIGEGHTIRGGVEYDANNIPVAYWIRERHPNDVGLAVAMSEPTRWERFAHPLGRAQVLHGFDPERAGQSRGVSAFASALKGFRALSRFSDATLQSAVINALVVGFMQSSSGPEAVSESFTAEDLAAFEGDREEFYKKSPVKIGEAILPVLPLGDELKLATASKDVGQFDAFFRSIYRLICATLGVTYEEGSMDYSSTNYSSARAAMIPAWKETEAFMGTIDAMLATPFHAAWLEEAFEVGHIAPANDNAPSWYEAQEAYAKGRWIGPGRGYIDQTKEVTAAAGRLEAMISTLEDECAEQGKDFVEVLDQREYEMSLIADRPHLAAAMAAGMNPLTGQAAAPAPPEGQVAPEDARPAARSALAQMRATADSPAHEAFLDARPAA